MVTKHEPPTWLTELAKRLLESNSAEYAAKLLGIGRESAVRLAAGLPIRKGTIAVAEQSPVALASRDATERSA